MANILIVEDDKNTQILISARLKPYFSTVIANNGREAFDLIFKQSFDLIITDIMMPEMNGYEFVKSLRDAGFDTPVLMLTAKQSFDDKKEGFSSGTDDYLTKPVNYDELIWRINALLRRAKIVSEKKITIGSTVINAATYSVSFNGDIIELPKKEFDLLYKLLSYPGKILTKNQLFDDIWGLEAPSSEDTIKTHISRIRSKLIKCGDFEIITVKGLGYKAEINDKKVKNGKLN